MTTFWAAVIMRPRKSCLAAHPTVAAELPFALLLALALALSLRALPCVVTVLTAVVTSPFALAVGN